jgi:putative ABC transport system permease protein
MAEIGQNLWLALRRLRKSKLFTISILATLALAMTGNSTVFGGVYSMLLDPLPFKDSGRLVMIWETNHSAGLEHASVAPTNFFGWQSQAKAFESMAALALRRLTLTGGEAQQVVGAAVSAQFFSVLDVHPALGRSFTEAEDQPGQSPVVVLSDALWRQRFGADPNVLGKSLTMDGESYTVVGVMPPDFQFLSDKPSVWVPLGLDRNAIWQEGRYLQVIARLRTGNSLQSAQADLSNVNRQLASLDPGKTQGWTLTLVPLYEEYAGKVRPSLLMLMTASLLVLVICCANMSSLTVARVIMRQGEVGVRAALGASRKRIIFDMLSETLLLAIGGAAVGLLVDYLGRVWFSRIITEVLSMPRTEQINTGFPVFIFTGVVALLVTLLAGLIPALMFSRADIMQLINQKSRGGSVGAGTRRLLNILVGIEVAVSVMLLIGAALMATTLSKLQAVDIGIRVENVLKLQVFLPDSKYSTDNQISRFFDDALIKIRAIPGVRSAGAIDWLPLSGSGTSTFFALENGTALMADKKPLALIRSVTPGYIETVGTPLLRGRLFTDADDAGRPRVYLINETFARRYFPGENPIGRRLVLTWSQPLIGEIVGVIGDVRSTELKTDPQVTVYWPAKQMPSGRMNFVVRSELPVSALVSAIAHEVHTIDNDIPLADVETMREVRDEATAHTRASAFLLSTYSVVALMLAIIGIFGLLSYTVACQTKEIGIRMALGASSQDILRALLKQVFAPFVSGLAAGLVGAIFLTRFMAQLLYGVKPTDPLIYVAVTLLFALVVVGAAVLPSRDALRIQPFKALQEE